MAIKASAAITLSSVVDVWSTTRYYLLQSSTQAAPAKPTTNPPAGGWDDTEPTYTSGSTNTLYFTDLTVFSDGSWAYSMVSVSSAYEAAKAAWNKAQAAQNAVSALDDSLTQQEIFNRLTDNGAAQGMVLYNGQLYVNASYMKSGTIDGNLVNAKLLNIVDANGNVIASFDSTIRLGQSTNAHAEIDFNSFEIKSSSSNSVFFAGDIRDANGRAEVSDSFVGDGTKTLFVLSLHATSITEVKINDVATSEWQLNGNRLWLYFTTAPASGAEIIVSYTTEDEAFRYDIGTRKSGSIIGAGSIAAGKSVESSGTGSYAEGQETHAAGYMSHSEGLGSKATGYVSHAEGAYTTASGENSHAEGRSTKASENYSHAEGVSTTASGYGSHAEGESTKANGEASHAEGVETIADGSCQHVAGKYNVSDPNKIEIIGNGEYGARSNARTLDWSGNEWIAGALSVGNAAGTRANLGITLENLGLKSLRLEAGAPMDNGQVDLGLSTNKIPLSVWSTNTVCQFYVRGSTATWWVRLIDRTTGANLSGTTTPLPINVRYIDA